MNEKNEQQKADVYKTSKTTWFLIGFMVLILAVIVFMMMRKKGDSPETTGLPQMQM
jgi:hypothetical protein